MAVTKQMFSIKKAHREQKNEHRAFVIWFTGLSGAGKSTLADRTEQYLFDKGYSTYVLDGDNVRGGINKDLDFSKESRTENIRRVSEIANLFCDAGIITLTAFISPYQSDRDYAKSVIGEQNFIEVFTDASVDCCIERDTKGLYAKAKKGLISNLTGLGDVYERPINPNIHLHTDNEGIEQSVQRLVTYLADRKYISL